MEEAILALERNEEENVVVTEPLDTNGLARFCSALRSSWRVKHLILRGLRLRPDGVEKIMAALQGNQTLTGLDLSFNELGDAGIKAVLIPLALGGSSSARGSWDLPHRPPNIDYTDLRLFLWLFPDDFRLIVWCR